jgi:putative transposase
MEKLDNNNHSVFLLTYHLIICIKYRRKAIDEQIAIRIKEIGEYVGNNHFSGIQS